MHPVECREALILENEGEKIFGVLHRPLKPTKVPALLICPGFAGNKCGKFRLFVTLAKELAKSGIAVLRFDYRGAGDSEGEFRDITLKGKVNDTLLCLNFLANDPQIDSSRIGILGRSLGGVISILAAKRFEKIRSLALWAPVFRSDPWRKLWDSFQAHHSVDLKTQEALRHLPAGIPNLEFLSQFFTLDIGKELESLVNVPLLHLHGSKDEVIKLEQAKEYEAARRGVANSRFLVLPSSDHDFSDAEERELAIRETCQWFKETL